MFANLKNKILDEVKASPQKFQQFAQAAQAAVSSASSTASESVSGSDNFFSITEEDTPQNSPHKSQPTNPSVQATTTTTAPNPPISAINNGNATANRTRKLSNSSVASDVSFRLPSYDSPAVYHLQSDLEASDVEESVAPSSSRLDLISKEQLHDAYKKALDRYQKYRSRYTDLAKRYRDLERDSTKARAVLVETQDKAIRRISELREQCTLEQQAKAHLEEALRMEMDDMQCKIKAYQTKLKLLGENPEALRQPPAAAVTTTDSEAALINLDESNLINVNGEVGQATNIEESNNLNEKILQLEQLLQDKINEVKELSEKLDESDKIVDNLKKREEENVILLAQNKLAIHSELENKEKEVKKLKLNLTEIESKLQQTEKERSTYKKQASELLDVQGKLKQITTIKQDIEAKLISTDHVLGELRKELKEKEAQYENSKKSWEEKLKTSAAEHETEINGLRGQINELNAMIERRNKTEIDLAHIDNELNTTKTVNDDLRALVDQLRSEKLDLERNLEENKKRLLEVVASNESMKVNESEFTTREENLRSELERVKQELLEVSSTKNTYEREVKLLEQELVLLRSQNDKTDSETVAALKESLQKANAEYNEKITLLEQQLLGKEKDFKELQQKYDDIKKDNDELTAAIASKEAFLSEEIRLLRENLEKSEQKCSEIVKEKQANEQLMEKEKIELKSQVTNILQEISRMEEEMKVVKNSHSQLEDEKHNLEKKIEKLTKQNLENQEGSKKWQQVLKDTEDKLKDLQIKLKTFEDESSKLREENCSLQENVNRCESLIKENDDNYKKEKSKLNDIIKEAEANYNTLRLSSDSSSENEKKLNEKMSQILDENSSLHNAKELMEHEFRSLQDQLDTKEKEKLCVLDTNKCLEDDLKILREENDNLKREATHIRNELQATTSKKSAEKEKREKLITDIKLIKKEKDDLENELLLLKEKLKTIDQVQVDMDTMMEQNIHLQEINKELLTKCEKLKHDYEKLLNDSNITIKTLEDKHNILEIENNTIKENLIKLNDEKQLIIEQNDKYKKDIDNIDNKNQKRLTELELLLKKTTEEKLTLKQSIKNATDLEKKLENYEQLKIENEYLTTLTNQLERDLNKKTEETLQLQTELKDYKDKLKSQQCELYVLKEKTEKHENDMELKQKEFDAINAETRKLNDILITEREDLKRQIEHNNFITGQNDMIQKELLNVQQKLQEAERLCSETRLSYEEVLNNNQNLQKQIDKIQISSKLELDKLTTEITNNQLIISDLTKELMQATKLLEKLQNADAENQQYQLKIQELETKLIELNNIKKLEQKNVETTINNSTTATTTDTDILRNLNIKLQNELEELKHKSSAQISNLTQEIDDLSFNTKHLSDKLIEYDKLKEQNQQLLNEIDKLNENQNNNSNNTNSNNINHNNNNNSQEYDSIRQEKSDLENKLNKIMHEVQDVSNRNLFLEQKCENYLILEQSNERLKLANEKLSRQLDETLVSMQHNEGIQANTEFEYLKNIMFQYLTGTVNGNNETLVKVIAAVLKFSPQQTQVAIEKEHQRHSLLGQINNLL